MANEPVSTIKKIDRSNRVYLTELDREASGADAGDLIQLSIKVIKKGEVPA